MQKTSKQQRRKVNKIVSYSCILTHASSIPKQIEWIKEWVITGNLTPFHEIRWLKYHANTQSNKDDRRPNVAWGYHIDEEVLTVDGLRVPWSGWNRLYTTLIERIKRDLKLVTFSTQLTLPPREAYIENMRDDRPGVNFATTLPEPYAANCNNHLLKHVLSTKSLRDDFILPEFLPEPLPESPPESIIQWNQVAGKEWMDQVDKLICSLCTLGYLCSGPGGRGEEWASMLGMNEQNGSRCVFWTTRGLCFMTGYSKVIQFLASCPLSDLPLLDQSHNSSAEVYPTLSS